MRVEYSKRAIADLRQIAAYHSRSGNPAMAARIAASVQKLVGKEGKPEAAIPKVSQETLAEMIGATRSRVSFFMNKFRKLGFIEYNGGLSVHGCC